MPINPFRLHDRIVPEDANDPVQVRAFAQALRDVGEPVPGDDTASVTQAARRFQASRGLAVDGVARVNGPTAQRLAGERHARQVAASPPPPKQTLHDLHSVPIRETVGSGGRNRPEDRASIQRALALTNHFSRFGALNPVALSQGTEDPELNRGVEGFRRKHGIDESGPVAVGSWTLGLLNDITAPILHHLIGPDASRPVGQESSAVPPVVRNNPDSATARSVPFHDEKRIAHEVTQDHAIAMQQARHIRQEMDAVSRGEVAPPPSAAERKLSKPAAVASGPDLRDTPELKDLTDRQVEQLHAIADEENFDTGVPQVRARLAQHVREYEPDFMTPLKAQLASGTITAAKLERLSENWARQLATHGTNPIALARLEAGNEVLKQALLQEGASAREAYDRVEALMNGAGQGDEDVSLLMQLFPPAGLLVGASELLQHFQEARKAQAEGDDDAAEKAWTAIALASAGSIPFAGKAVKLVVRSRIAQRARDFVLKHDARRKLIKMQADFNKPFRATHAEEFFEKDVWAGFDKKTQQALETTFTKAKGKAGEEYVRNLIVLSGLEVPLQGTQHLRRIMIKMPSGVWASRHYDEITFGKLKPILRGYAAKIIKTDQGVAHEIKTGASRVTKNQKIKDAAVNDKAERISNLAKKAHEEGYNLPDEIEDDIQQLRLPLWAIPEKALISDWSQRLAKKNVPAEIIDQLAGGIAQTYALERKLRRDGNIELARRITLRSVIVASSLAVTGLSASDAE